jgi:hypothetical protein
MALSRKPSLSAHRTATEAETRRQRFRRALQKNPAMLKHEQQNERMLFGA